MKNNFDDNSLDPVTTYTNKIVGLENVGESCFFNRNSSSSCEHLQAIQGSEDLQLSHGEDLEMWSSKSLPMAEETFKVHFSSSDKVGLLYIYFNI